MGLFGSRWIALRTESGSRADLLDRMEAYFKDNGLRTKITDEGNSLKRIHVLKKDADKARALLEIFDQEH